MSARELSPVDGFYTGDGSVNGTVILNVMIDFYTEWAPGVLNSTLHRTLGNEMGSIRESPGGDIDGDVHASHLGPKYSRSVHVNSVS
jgi:hypothetical protein